MLQVDRTAAINAILAELAEEVARRTAQAVMELRLLGATGVVWVSANVPLIVPPNEQPASTRASSPDPTGGVKH